MRVLGVDPGLTRCGLAVVEVSAARKVRLICAEVVRTSPDDELGRRLLGVEEGVARVLGMYAPDSLAIERVFSQHNVKTVIGTAQAAGVAALVATRAGVPVAFHTPSEVKAAVTGSGRADKAQVASMVSRIVGEQLSGPADLTDAVALAICHGWRFPSQQALTRAVAAAGPSAGRGGVR
jgi:crossover junction endodeoxyribonuclease RuvC